MGQVAGIEFFSKREQTLHSLFQFYSHTQEERLLYASLMLGDHFRSFLHRELLEDFTHKKSLHM